MPLSSHQLGALVERAKQKAPSVVTSPLPPPATRPSRPVRIRQAASAPQTSSTVPPAPKIGSSPPDPLSTPQRTANKTTLEPEDFPISWVLGRESWRFHRRFYAVFRRPMRPREYSYLLHQIPNRAQHLGADCWLVTLPDGKRTLPIRASHWRLITILPKDWQPPPGTATQNDEPFTVPSVTSTESPSTA